MFESSKPQVQSPEAGREALCIVNLVGSSIKTVRQELQLSDGADVGRHLNHPDQLIALHRPQVEQVGATASSEEPSIPADPSQARFIYHRYKTTLEKKDVTRDERRTVWRQRLCRRFWLRIQAPEADACR